MQTKQLKFKLSLIVCIVLIAAMALITTGCNDKKDDFGSSLPSTTVSQTESQELGKGDTKFTFTVTDAKGKETSYKIATDKKTVGDALVELGLIAGEQGDYGLYVKTVNGITVDYDKDGKYSAFYVDGEYAQKGIDATEITEGATYSLKVE